MVEIAEIVDGESFKAWLGRQGLSRSSMVWLGFRSAARVFPIWTLRCGVENEIANFDLHSLAVLRSLVISMVFTATNESNIRGKLSELAKTAGSRADAATQSAATFDYDDASEASRAAYAARGTIYTESAQYGAAASARYASFAVSSVSDASDFWHTLQSDCAEIAASKDLLPAALWPDVENPLSGEWQQSVRQLEGRSNYPWAFWLDWYQRLLDGTEDRWDLLTDIALLDKDADGNDLWQDPEKLAAEIARLEAEYAAKQEPQPVSNQLAKMPPPSEATVAQVKTAMERHRRDLPPTFDALTGYLSLEIERLQSRNYRDEDDREESERQIRVLLTIAEAVEKLQALVPASGEMPQEDAVEATKLGQLYVQKFKEWPREHAGDLVDSSFRMALVGGTTVLLPMIGITQPIAFAAGLVLFGGKKMTEAVKAAKEAMS